jgi:hypothetical protein
MYFHSGATLGQQAVLGFRTDTGTALAAVCTRRFRAHDPFLATAYALLAQEQPAPAPRRRHMPRRRRTALAARHTRCHRAGVRVGAHPPWAWWVCRHR